VLKETIFEREKMMNGLPEVKKECLEAVVEKVSQDGHLYKSINEVMEGLHDSGNVYLAMTIQALAERFGEDDPKTQTVIASSISIILKAVNAQLEANALAEQFGE
jgi:hypothetical protein